jgi:hypothetical protein
VKSVLIPTAPRSVDDPLPYKELAIVRRISPKRVIALLSCVMISLIIAGIASKYAKLRLGEDGLHQYHIQEITRQFDLDDENNIASYYQVSTLQFCSLLLLLIYWAKRGAGDRYHLHWGMLALTFLFLSADEAASLHEATIRPLRNALRVDDFLYFAWVVPAIAVVLIMALSYWRFLLALPAKTRRLFFIAGAFYISGGVGIEIIGGHLLKLHGEQSIQYSAGTVTEEALEMIGVLIFIYALLSYLCAQVRELHLKFEDRKS